MLSTHVRLRPPLRMSVLWAAGANFPIDSMGRGGAVTREIALFVSLLFLRPCLHACVKVRETFHVQLVPPSSKYFSLLSSQKVLLLTLPSHSREEDGEGGGGSAVRSSCKVRPAERGKVSIRSN